VKWVKDEQIWSVAPLSRIQKLKEETNLLPACADVFKGMQRFDYIHCHWISTVVEGLTMFDITQE